MVKYFYSSLSITYSLILRFPSKRHVAQDSNIGTYRVCEFFLLCLAGHVPASRPCTSSDISSNDQYGRTHDLLKHIAILMCKSKFQEPIGQRNHVTWCLYSLRLHRHRLLSAPVQPFGWTCSSLTHAYVLIHFIKSRKRQTTNMGEHTTF